MVRQDFFGPLLAGILLLHAQSGAAAEPIVLEQTSDWVMDYKENSCALRAAFGHGDAEVILELDQFIPGIGYRLSVQTSSFERVSETPQIQFAPDGEVLRYDTYFNATFPEGRTGIFIDLSPYITKDSDAREILSQEGNALAAWMQVRESQISSLRISNVYTRDLVLELGRMAAPFKAVHDCMTDLMKSINVEAMSVDVSRRNRAKDLPGWTRKIQAGFPRNMVPRRTSAILAVRLVVDREGNVSHCYVRDDGQDDSFSPAACEGFYKYARFEPALDEAGKPISSIWSTYLIYRAN